MQVVSDSHAPADDHVLCSNVMFRDLLNLFPGDTAAGDDVVPRCCCGLATELFKSFGVLVEKRLILAATIQNFLRNSQQPRHVATDVGLHVTAGDFGTEQQTFHVAGNAKVHQSQFPDRIDNNHLPAATPNLHQGLHQTRMVR